MAVVAMSYLLEAGVHFGHQTKRWNPKMKEYIYSTRDDIYIMDLQKTTEKLEEAYDALKKIVEDGGKVLLSGNKYEVLGNEKVLKACNVKVPDILSFSNLNIILNGCIGRAGLE